MDFHTNKTILGNRDSLIIFTQTWNSRCEGNVNHMTWNLQLIPLYWMSYCKLAKRLLFLYFAREIPKYVRILAP